MVFLIYIIVVHSTNKSLSTLVDKFKTDLDQVKERNKQLENDMEEISTENQKLQEELDRLKENTFWTVRDQIMKNQKQLLRGCNKLSIFIDTLNDYLQSYTSDDKKTIKSIKEFQGVVEDKLNCIITELMILFKNMEEQDNKYCECVYKINANGDVYKYL